MKKINYYYVACTLAFFALLMSSPVSKAWPNQYHDSLAHTHRSTGTYISEYRNDYFDNPNIVKNYYSTHDWIAESALGLLYNVKTDDFLTKLYDFNDLRFWYLFGTELPDSRGISPDFETDCGLSFDRYDFLSSLHNYLYFGDETTSDKPPDAAAQVAQNDVYPRIKEALEERKDCQEAALFMGYLMHIVADTTYYGHVTVGASLHATFYAHMDHVTHRTWHVANGDRTNEFFNIAEATAKVTSANLNSHTYVSPYLATRMAGIDTFFGSMGAPPYYQTAIWMLGNAPYSTPVPNHRFWNNVKPGVNFDVPKPNYFLEDTWTHADRPITKPQIGEAAYFNTLEHNLNTAIYYCALALNWVLDNVDYTDCLCSGENPPRDDGQQSGDNEPVGEETIDRLKVAMDEFESLLFFSFAGLASSLITLALSKVLLKQVEKYVFPFA